MSKDTIYREDAIEAVEELNAISFYELNEHSKEAFIEIRRALKALPSAGRPQLDKYIVERIGNGNVIMSEDTYEDLLDRPQGKWILECDAEGEDDNLYRCSECGCNYSCQEYDLPNFCPDCGRKMLKGASADIDCFDTCKHAFSEVCDECYKGDKYNAVKGADDVER